MDKKYNSTIYSCFTGYIVQAIVINFLPLLFLRLQGEYNIPLAQITLLITLNFIMQLLVDVAAISFVDKIGYRATAVIAHIFAALGLVLLAILPDMLPSPFIGILISVLTYAIGGGLLEVVISPIVEACPTENKEKAMSLLHSFYCWGQVGVVLLSTIYFAVFGIENWRLLAVIWAVVPVINTIAFTRVPMVKLEEHAPLNIKELFSQKIFWVFMLIMVAAGASEQSISQWASTFAEQGLGITKALGDIAGPMAFAVCMGLSRAYYGKHGDKIQLDNFMIISGASCVALYLIVVFVPVPIIALICSAMCGLTVGIMWPGTFSMASTRIKGGTAMFALLALGGDLGCSAGPTVVGFVSGVFDNNLRIGILAAVLFPIILTVCIMLIKRSRTNVA